jgi:hypothetical protein
MKKKTTKKREASRPALKDLNAREAHSVKGGLAASQLNNTTRLSTAGGTASSGESSAG